MMFSIDIILLIVLLLLISLIAPIIILGIVTFFEIKRGVIAKNLPAIDLMRPDLSSIRWWSTFFYCRIKSQKATYGLLAIVILLLMLSLFTAQVFTVSEFNDYNFDEVLVALGLISYFYTLVASLIVFDARYYLLPDPLNYLLLWSGVVVALLGISVISLEESIIAVILIYLLLWGIRMSYQWAGKKDALGLGDLKLSAALAAWCGLEAIFSVLLLATLLALSCIVLKQIRQRVRVQVIPFGPFLGISGIIHYLMLFSFR
ncbi:hypothetical protein DC083_00405 [Ignatzschineria ureiclastica]|uniref:Prepilin type IV endopeptidase peptidase domain-containing protein n=1 Tax=Ignatzschineria ureiclastica TaxID=472582 RepID=A0A2U2AGA9_9GAMM|nr:A24 family peptidase [Ignatzschineria ureiclastica]PWD81696.1 hypothetical protein DC083_00405 [Ignatzschineria ureiclastica]GGZ89979.1 hypothetical protein GCM10007162_00800 [Ignatzschineria ureiclastica]